MSLNYHTPDEICTVKYNDLDQGVIKCLEVKNECSNVHFDEIEDDNDNNNNGAPLFLGKSDIKSAFHLVPLAMGCWRWLIMMAINPKTRKTQYFVDKCLPFGASISCAIFQRFSNALSFIVQFRIPRRSLVNYLNDFLFIAYSRKLCNEMISCFINICQ